MSTTPDTTTNTPEPSRISRRWAIPMAFVGGAAAVALAGGAVLASTDTASTAQLQMVRGEHGEHGERGPDQAMRMQRMAEVDPEMRGQHVAELAQRLGVDVEELTATLETFRAERTSLHDELAALAPAERREAMREFADTRRAALAAVLGVDADVLAELHAEIHGEAGHGQAGRGPRGPQGGRMGTHLRS